MEKQIYSKAYVELYELIKHLSIEEQNEIPDTYKNNLLKAGNVISVSLSQRIGSK